MTQSTPFYTPLTTTKTPLGGTTLIIPAVSIGSVPQLAVDLLLHDASLQLVKVGRIDPSFCFPFAGPSDFDDDEITTALEVFSNGQLTVIQQRSPVYRSFSTQYINALTSWITQTSFIEVLWLSSIDSAFRTDQELSTPILSLSPRRPTTPLLSKVTETYPPFANPHHIPGSLLTAKLLKHTTQSNLNIAALLYFAAEGDTRPDAHSLANSLLSLLSPPHTQQALTEPQSWSSLFGRPPTSSLYA